MASGPKFRKKVSDRPVRRCKGRQWRRTREEFFGLDPLNRLCAVCLKNGITREAVVCDHKIPVSRRPDLEFEFSNLQGLCAEHDRLKTDAENRGER